MVLRGYNHHHYINLIILLHIYFYASHNSVYWKKAEFRWFYHPWVVSYYHTRGIYRLCHNYTYCVGGKINGRCRVKNCFLCWTFFHNTYKFLDDRSSCPILILDQNHHLNSFCWFLRYSTYHKLAQHLECHCLVEEV